MKLILGILRSFKYAFRGVLLCIKHETNFRIHLLAVIYVSIFSLLYRLTYIEYILLFMTFGFVIFAEMINTVIETLINMNVNGFNSFARNAKDITAGAVMIFSFFSVGIAFFLFNDISKWIRIFNLFRNNFPLAIILLISFVPAILFIKGKKH